MKSKLAVGTTLHERFFPSSHSFAYPISLYCLDLDELPELDKQIPFLSINRFNFLSIWEKDYGNWDTGGIKEKIIARCQKKEAFLPGRVLLITTPKTLGWVFNPVSFYLLHDETELLRFFVLEINNTFYERCQYILPVSQAKVVQGALQWHLTKEFHVSPFYGMDYDYCITLKLQDDAIRIDIVMMEEGKAAFIADADLTLFEIETATGLLPTVHRASRMALTFPRICYQALYLWLRRRLPVLNKPNPELRVIVRATPVSLLDQLCLTIGRRYLRRLKKGHLLLVLPDGREERYGDETAEPTRMFIRSYDFFRKALLAGSVGFGETYTDGDWDADDPAAVVELFLNNYDALTFDTIPFTKMLQKVHAFLHWLNRNTLRGSKRNISAHYDLNNDFFKLFLDKSMVYSSGIYSGSDGTLEDSQRVKLEAITEKAKLQPGLSVLEIGSGWGALAEKCAVDHGCSVTSLTLSAEQKKYAEANASARGLADRIDYRLQDYREASGSFDRIVSVEMLEAVGKENLGEFFRSCDSLLTPEGLLVVQVISYPDTHYKDYCNRSDWIQKHIFPGSHLPSLSALLAAASEHSFIAEAVENYSLDYAITLREWRRRFDTHLSDVRRLGFDDEFIRKWRFYLAACEAEFNSRWLSVYQIVFTRPNNQQGLGSMSLLAQEEEVA